MYKISNSVSQCFTLLGVFLKDSSTKRWPIKYSLFLCLAQLEIDYTRYLAFIQNPVLISVVILHTPGD